MKSPRLIALLAVVILVLLVLLYVREFVVLSNTIGVGWLVAGAMLVALALSGGAIWHWRARFTPWARHFPGVVIMLVFSGLFAPLFGSLLNRSLGRDTDDPFQFVSETAYFASGYGVLKGEKLSPTGWRLVVREAGRERRFKYKTQAYFPLTKSGEQILLPMRHGLFGARVMKLR